MSYTKLQYHIVFSTKERRPLIAPEWKDRLNGYIGGVIRNLGGQLLAAGGPEDHIHLTALLTQKHSIMDVLREIKCNSSAWVHSTLPVASDFDWQDGYACFTVSQSGMSNVIAYVRNQVEHHKEEPFQEELIKLLKLHEIEYDERYIFA